MIKPGMPKAFEIWISFCNLAFLWPLRSRNLIYKFYLGQFEKKVSGKIIILPPQTQSRFLVGKSYLHFQNVIRNFKQDLQKLGLAFHIDLPLKFIWMDQDFPKLAILNIFPRSMDKFDKIPFVRFMLLNDVSWPFGWGMPYSSYTVNVENYPLILDFILTVEGESELLS